MATSFGITFLDASNEKSRVNLYTADMDSSTIVTLPDLFDIAGSGAVVMALAALSLCSPIGTDYGAAISKMAQVIPGNALAQREIGLLVTYSDNVTGKSYHFTVPGPDWATLKASGTDFVNTAATAWQNFKAAFEAHCVSPDGNAVTLNSGRLVGRNR